MKKVILILIFMSTINSYAGTLKYLYYPFNPTFPEQNVQQAVQTIFDHGIRSTGVLTGDTLLDFCNDFRNTPQQAYFGLLYPTQFDIPEYAEGLNGVVLAIDPGDYTYSARKSIEQAIKSIDQRNDPSGLIRKMLQEVLNHGVPSNTAIIGLPDPADPTTPPLIPNIIIRHATIIYYGSRLVIRNTHYASQPNFPLTTYTFLRSQQEFPTEPMAVVPHQDVTYAEACGNNTRNPASQLRLPAEPSGSVCSNPPEKINAQEYLKRINRHHAIKLLPAMQSFLLLN